MLPPDQLAPPALPTVLTTTEAGRVIGISRQHAWRLSRCGVLKAIARGLRGQSYFAEPAVREFAYSRPRPNA